CVDEHPTLLSGPPRQELGPPDKIPPPQRVRSAGPRGSPASSAAGNAIGPPCSPFGGRRLKCPPPFHIADRTLSAETGEFAMNPQTLESYVSGRWTRGDGVETSLVDPVSGEMIATASAKGVDLKRALAFARRQGQGALRPLSYAARAKLIGAVADTL